jgi:hypothetical protein
MTTPTPNDDGQLDDDGELDAVEPGDANASPDLDEDTSEAEHPFTAADYAAAAAEVEAELADKPDFADAFKPGEPPAPPTDDIGNEAAKYRTRLRAAETELGALHDQVEAMQRAEAQRLAQGKLSDTADLWRDGATLDTVLGDDGHVDPDKVTELTNTVIGQHPHWAVQHRRVTGQFTSGAGRAGPRVDKWQNAFGPASRPDY